MKFKKLKLNNFRQYIGENNVEFCFDAQKNVTLIFGANGFGKTGIFRAIMFGLYGDRFLKQDKLTKEQEREGLILVNEKLLEENLNQKVTATVSIEFEDNSKNYILTRNIIGQKTERQTFQEPGDVSLIVTENSNTKPPINDYEEISTIISSIVNEKIRDFFLFDGEQMEELTKYSKESRNEVKKGIKALLQLDTIEIAQEALKKNVKDLNNQIEVNSSGELEIISEKLTETDDKISNNEKELEDLNNNIQMADDDEKEIRQKIDENKEALEKQKDRENIKKQLHNLESEINRVTQQLKEMLENSGSYVGLPVITELYTELDSLMEKGELPSGVREEFIEKLINECRCICGTNLNENQHAKDFLLNYKNNKNDKVSDSSIKVYRLTHELKTKIEHSQKDVESALQLFNKHQEENNLLNKKLEDLDEDLKGIKPIQDLTTRLEKIKNDRNSYRHRLGQLDIQLKKLKEEREELKRKQEVLSAKNEKALKLIKQRDIVEKSVEELNKIYTEYSDELRDNLSKCATDIFKKIADPDSLKSLSNIVISEDFQLEVLSTSGTKMLSQISSGQRQIVSLAYICALLKVASNLEMPLLMDTPFGRLSGAPRDACLKELPEILTQWILLATDTEFQTDEASALRASEKWGCVYEISHYADRQSKIESKDINNWQPQRRTR